MKVKLLPGRNLLFAGMSQSAAKETNTSQSALPVDEFKISMLYPIITNGRGWFSRWNTRKRAESRIRQHEPVYLRKTINLK